MIAPPSKIQEVVLKYHNKHNSITNLFMYVAEPIYTYIMNVQLVLEFVNQKNLS